MNIEPIRQKVKLAASRPFVSSRRGYPKARRTFDHLCENLDTEEVERFEMKLGATGLNELLQGQSVLGHSGHQAIADFLDEVRVPASSLIGTEGGGFAQLFATLNPERILCAAGAVGTGRLAVNTAVNYAKEREVFGQPIGAHQAVQHPLAIAYAQLESAWDSVLRAAWLYDQGAPDSHVGAVSNMAKYLAVEAALEACSAAVQTHGGNGYAREYHVERWLRECQLFRLAPVTQQMTLNFIGDMCLGYPGVIE